jgi:quinol monooxygenase YgiN
MIMLLRRDFLVGAMGVALTKAPANRFGMIGKVVARQGQRDALAQVLVDAAELVGKAPGCELYVVHTATTEPEVVWVTEVWRSKEDHAASLSVKGVKELIAKGRPLIAEMGDPIFTTPVGGKGLAPL